MKVLEGAMEATLKTAVSGLEDRMQRNEDNLEANVNKALDKRLDEFKGSVNDMLDTRLAGIHQAQGAAMYNRTREEGYLVCRRSLRMWPIDENNKIASLKDFLLRKLKFTGSEVDAMGLFEFQPVTSRSKNVSGEVAVVFRSSELRDRVRASAKNLAGDRHSGIRLHIPGFLESNFKVLENISYALKQKHPGLRRNIKYDDQHRDLMLDFQTKPGEPWRTVLPEQARKYNGCPRTENPTNKTLSVDDLSDIMNDLPIVSD